MELTLAFAAFALLVASWAVIGRRRILTALRVAARSLARDDAA
jgi:hypothetical protein